MKHAKGARGWIGMGRRAHLVNSVRFEELLLELEEVSGKSFFEGRQLILEHGACFRARLSTKGITRRDKTWSTSVNSHIS